MRTLKHNKHKLKLRLIMQIFILASLIICRDESFTKAEETSCDSAVVEDPDISASFDSECRERDYAFVLGNSD